MTAANCIAAVSATQPPIPFGTDAARLFRADSPDTSRAAALAVDTTRLEAMVFEAVRSFPAGCIQDDVLARFRDMPYSSVTARFRALLDKGLIVDTGDRRRGRSGRSQRVLLAACLLAGGAAQ